MDSIQLKTKELQSKMYLTETHRVIDSLDSQNRQYAASVEVPGPHFELKEINFYNYESLVGSYEDSGKDPIRILGRILSGSYQDPVGSYQNANLYLLNKALMWIFNYLCAFY